MDISQAGFCPKCKRENKESMVYKGSYRVETLMDHGDGYYEVHGIFIKIKNPNTYIQDMSCSEGHKWVIKGWVGETGFVVEY